MKDYLIIQETNFERARKKIRESRLKNPNFKIIFSGGTDKLNRKILEKENIDILLLNQSKRKDKLKERNSRLNQILARMAKRNGIVIGINLDEIINSAGKEKADILARIKQNIKLCSKNKLDTKFIAIDKKNDRDIYDLKALGLVLGMPTWMTKEI